MAMFSVCQIEFGNGANVIRCGEPAVAECADCRSSICSGCRTECCADSFCDYCYDYHAAHPGLQLRHRLRATRSDQNAA
jgi:hypothetical protein